MGTGDGPDRSPRESDAARQHVLVSASTIPELLAAAAARGNGSWTFHSGRQVMKVPVGDLYARALRRSSQLAAAGVGPGTNIGLVGLNAPPWAEWAWATWLAGATLVPLPAPLIAGSSFAQQIASLAEATGCSVVVGERRYLNLLKSGGAFARWDWSAPAPHDGPVPGTWASGAPWGPAGPGGQAPPGASSTAVVLSTSGSTAAPKGVRMSHARAVEWARHNRLRAPGGAVPAVASWFPFYHIAGLGLLFEVIEPVDYHIVAMKSFLADPLRWLRLVGQTRASYAVSPSSVWAEVLDALGRHPEEIDLSHLDEVAFNAELAGPDVVARLRRVGARSGLRPGAIGVHYASSEAGMISRTPVGSDPRVDTVDLAELGRSGRAVPPPRRRAVKRVVSCGRPYAGAEICIGSPDRPLPERELGEVWVRGPGVTDGYVTGDGNGNFSDGWLRLGDLAYVSDGEIFVTGRSDEVVVYFGEKYHPEDIERAVTAAIGLAPRTCVAFSRQDRGPGEFVVVVETAERGDDLAGQATAAVAHAIGIAPSEVVVVPPGTVPVTPNGKLQRSRLRQMHHEGELEQWRT